MNLKRLCVLACLACFGALAASPVLAGISAPPTGYVCDPANHANCIKPNPDGSINTSGGGGVQPIAGADGSTKTSTSNPLPVSFDGQSAPSGTNVGYNTTTTVFSVSEAGMAQVNFFLSTTASLSYAFEATSDPTCTTGWAGANATNGASTYNGGTFTGGFGFTHYVNEACFRVRVSSASGGTGSAWWQGVRGLAPVVSNTGQAGVSASQSGAWNVNTSTGWTDSTTALGASSTFTGTGRSLNGNAAFSYFNACAYADQSGTLQVQQSVDTGSTYQTIASANVTAASGQCIHEPLAGAFSGATLYRVQYVNGSSAQGTFRLSSAFTAN